MATFRSRRLLRPAGFDELGLRRAISDRILPFLVAAMAVLAALALAGWVGAASLAQHWQQGASSALTVQVPQPREPAAQGGGTRLERVETLLVATPGVASARALSDDELGELLRPWLGSDAERLMQLLKEMNRLGTTVVVATHNDALVGRHPGRALRLSRGRLVEQP